MHKGLVTCPVSVLNAADELVLETFPCHFYSVPYLAHEVRNFLSYELKVINVRVTEGFQALALEATPDHNKAERVSLKGNCSKLA
jgi:hypothetical protein